MGPPSQHIIESESFLNIDQLDGNVSICSNSNQSVNLPKTKHHSKADRITTALNLPIVASYNLRSLGPKVNSLKTDLIERSIDLAFLQEIWEPKDNKAF